MAALPRHVLETMEAAGLDTAALARSVGVPPDCLRKELAPEDGDRFLTAAWEALDDPAFGLKVGLMYVPERFGIVGLCAMAASNLGVALSRLARYSRLAYSDEFQVLPQADETTLRMISAGPERPYSRGKVDMDFSSKFSFARRITGVNVQLVRIRLQAPMPAHAAKYAEHYECPVLFDQQEDSMTFHNADLDLKLVSSNPQFFEIFENYAQSALAEEARLRTEQRVRTALRRVLRGDAPTLAAVAHEMSMSTRTLQRKLADEGLRFSGIVDAMRQEIAEQHVARGRASMVEIAYMLGFADPQSFYRAFKRWTGTTPTNFRNPAAT